jgi:hypothetical protein
VGINRHISRVLLVLGSVASGRLWPLATPAAIDCVLNAPLPEKGPSHEHRIAMVQEVTPSRFLDPESSYVEHLCALAAFGDALSAEEDVAEMLRALLRKRNRALLERVLPAAEPQPFPDRKLSRMDDVAELMTLGQGFGGRGKPAPEVEPGPECACGSGKPFRRCHGADEDATGADPPPAGRARPEPTEPPPVLDFVLDPAPDGSPKTIGKPEDMVGLTGRTGGKPFIIDSIVGMGRHKVVFGLTYLETGERKCLAMYLSSFREAPDHVHAQQLNGEHF